MDVHTYTAGETGLFVNSYLLETPSEVIVVDTNLLNSDIAALKARVDAVGKPLAGVFVTHAHPDHFNGVHALVHGTDIPVYATIEVAATIRRIADAKRAQWGPVYGDQWPAVTTYPTVELADGEQVRFDGVTITARELGPGESHADGYLLATPDDGRPVAFIGDLAFHGFHPYTADGHGEEWLATLDVLAKELSDVRTLYPGHGAPTGPEILAEQRRHLMFYREAVRRLAGGAATLTDEAKAELELTMRRYEPEAGLSWMIALGADATAAEFVG